MRSAGAHYLLMLLPLAVVAAFWAMASLERRRDGGVSFTQRNGAAIATYLVVAVGLWSLFMIVLPQLSMIELSFRPKLPTAQIGGPRDVYTLQNYRYFLFGSTTDTSHWNSIHIHAFFLTIFASILVTAFDLALCYPLAFYMAQAARPRRVRLLLLLLIAPYWVNEVLRAFAFRVIFATGGVLNAVLTGLGLIGQPIDFLGLDIGMYAGLSYAYLLLMVFPLYNALESLPASQIEAARDLGAPLWRIHWRVVIPHAKPGIAVGCILVYTAAAGSYIVPSILAAPGTRWFTEIIYQWFYEGQNWPQGSAYAFLLLLLCLVFVFGMMRIFRVGLSDIAR